jgi:hypothetical protein
VEKAINLIFKALNNFTGMKADIHKIIYRYTLFQNDESWDLEFEIYFFRTTKTYLDPQKSLIVPVSMASEKRKIGNL